MRFAFLIHSVKKNIIAVELRAGYASLPSLKIRIFNLGVVPLGLFLIPLKELVLKL